jgi:phosphoribosylformylglycinamidine cyclo-ligase
MTAGSGRGASGTTYRDAGVDIDEADRAKGLMRKHVRSTFDSSVITDMGAFAGVIGTEKLKKFREPVLVASMDGVGTKLIIAKMMDKWDTVGADIVNHSVNDILCLGAEPFFFLDYVAAAKLSAETVEQILKGMAQACRENGMPLVAGETAEMPGVYRDGEHDVAGCIVGVADRAKFVNGRKIAAGDVLIGLPSSGLHTNGYSLARKVLFDVAKMKVTDALPGTGRSVGDVLLEPHVSYSKAVLKLMDSVDVHGIVHVTGGGFPGNIPRVLPDGVAAQIEKKKIKVPPIFRFIQDKGSVPEEDMYRTFNMGVGLIIMVPAQQADGATSKLKAAGHDAYVIGRIVKGNCEVKLI